MSRTPPKALGPAADERRLNAHSIEDLGFLPEELSVAAARAWARAAQGAAREPGCLGQGRTAGRFRETVAMILEAGCRAAEEAGAGEAARSAREADGEIRRLGDRPPGSPGTERLRRSIAGRLGQAAVAAARQTAQRAGSLPPVPAARLREALDPEHSKALAITMFDGALETLRESGGGRGRPPPEGLPLLRIQTLAASGAKWAAVAERIEAADQAARAARSAGVDPAEAVRLLLRACRLERGVEVLVDGKPALAPLRYASRDGGTLH